MNGSEDAARTANRRQTLLQQREEASAIVLVVKRCAATPATLRTRSVCRTCAAALRNLLALMQGDDDGDDDADPSSQATRSIAQADVTVLCQSLLACLAWGLPGDRATRGEDTTASSSVRRRDRSGVHAGAFAGFPVPVPGERSVKRQSSSSSIGSSRSAALWDTESAASDLDGEGHGGDEEDNHAVCRAIRQRSIGCLNALNTCAAKGLLLSWPLILCEEGRSTGQASLLDVIAHDVASSNRIAACRVIEAYMQTGAANGFFAGAEERTRLNAFTSLSSRIAATVVQCRARLAGVLASSTTTTSNITEAVLRCTTALVHATSSVKLRHSHADFLRPVTLKLCASTEALVAVRAYALLTALMAGDTANRPVTFQMDDVVATIQDPQKPASVKVGAWNALAASKDGHGDLSLLAQLASDQFSPDIDADVRQAVAAYVLAAMQRDEQWPAAVTQKLAADSLASVRAVAADCLAICAPNDKLLARLATLDIDSTVRAAAARAIGVAIQQSKASTHVDALRRALGDSSSLVRQRASWSWGNLCEAEPQIAYLTDCLALQRDDDRIVVHAIRGIGALLAAFNDWRDVTAAVEALRWLATLLSTSKDPKMRWNTCASLGRMLASSSSAVHIVELDGGRGMGIIALLSSTLAHDKTFKTRLTACQALQSALDNVGSSRLSYASTAIRESVHDAVQRIDEQIAKASFREAQLHAVPLQRALRKLADDDHLVGEGDAA